MLHQADMSSLAVDSLLKQLARDRQAIFKAAVDWQSVLNQLLSRRFKPMSCTGPDFLAVTPSWSWLQWCCKTNYMFYTIRYLLLLFVAKAFLFVTGNWQNLLHCRYWVAPVSCQPSQVLGLLPEARALDLMHGCGLVFCVSSHTWFLPSNLPRVAHLSWMYSMAKAVYSELISQKFVLRQVFQTLLAYIHVWPCCWYSEEKLVFCHFCMQVDRSLFVPKFIWHGDLRRHIMSYPPGN